VRGERSGPIGISGGDFATPTARKRTTTQPRGVPVLSPPKNGTPQPVGHEGAQPESPFGAPPSGDFGDAASQLAAEAAAVRALDSGPLTPPPVVDDPGPTPPPEPMVMREVSRSLVEGAPTPAPESAAPAPAVTPTEAGAAGAVTPADEPPREDGAAAIEALEPPSNEAPAPSAPSEFESPGADAEVAAVPSESLPAVVGGIDLEVETAEDHFAAQETPWPELPQQSAGLRAPTPVPGAIPTDAMGGDSGGARDGVEAAAPEPIRVDEPPRDEADVATGDELVLDDAAENAEGLDDAAENAEGLDDAAETAETLDDAAESAETFDDAADGAETLDALPAEALSDGAGDSSSAAEVAPPTPTPPPTPRAAAAPPPIPAGSPRRKTGEMRAPEVPTAQVVASIVPSIPAAAATLPEALAQRPRRPKRSKPWFEEVFDEDYLRTLPFMSADQTLREVEFIEASLAVKPGAQVLDIGCGYGRHAIELVQRGLDVTGLDLSLPLLLRAADEAQRRAMSVNFVHADMREMAFEKQFDGAYCMLTSFGYFDEDANLRVAEGIGRSLKPGGRFLLDIVNRDYVVSDLPSRVWWEGNGCVVLEEVDFNFHTSRILTHRSIVFEDGRQLEQEISVRAYSLHEIGRLLRQAGFRVIDISGGLATRGHFFGVTSRSLLILAEKRPDEA
jgi:SAM-dependent methyltransferase